MEVDLKLTFDAEEIKAMVLHRCDSIDCPVEGRWEISTQYSYLPPIVARFVPKEETEIPALTAIKAEVISVGAIPEFAEAAKGDF